MSFFKNMCPGCCGEPVKKPVFVLGADEDKKWFLEQFGVKIGNEFFQEYSVLLGGTNVIFSFVKDDMDDENVKEQHINSSVAVVVLSHDDEATEIKKPVFHVLMNGKSKMLSDGNFVVNSDKDNIKKEFLAFVSEFE